MSTERKPITIYGQTSSPDLSSLQILLKELGIAYNGPKAPSADEKEHLDYLVVNAEGGEPCIQDPNTQTVLGEIGAVFEYLVSNYDKDHRVIFRRGTPEFWLAKQWLCFHVAVQAPVFRQAQWFKTSQSREEKLFGGATGRFIQEVQRVTAVLESQLAKQEQKYPGSGGPWVVGDKLSFVDLALISWQTKIGTILEKDEYDGTKYPHLQSWIDRLTSLPSMQQFCRYGS
ncbi:uncharacterized protein Z520_11277 [Fonsecaea multimorphosa CBS 102226]|uniref:GST C-terminal domain-containing protein n=1 Tax=Fonsecaea multimorphosa CBS 102226 TaxID=1442371 RepID=A0A0D2JRC0_9EURO|nr:uncharacterized protein Z520_11277 [Fonsecaea multimorphosa CBS 102226]KIX93004.1 hypothetical protein Z520_11277 [Fonsecaea multimorphosa CBS 102226]OAL18253.1 hypothetical protein AYO22_10831 [Fonsecaea multimorphosa]